MSEKENHQIASFDTLPGKKNPKITCFIKFQKMFRYIEGTYITYSPSRHSRCAELAVMSSILLTAPGRTLVVFVICVIKTAFETPLAFCLLQ